MKRTILMVLALLPLLVFGQIKKKPVAKPTQEAIMLSNAKKWFKEVYVESTFKDPYSYKLLKSKIYSWSYKNEYESNLTNAKEKLAYYDTTSVKYKSLLNNFSYRKKNLDSILKIIDGDTARITEKGRFLYKSLYEQTRDSYFRYYNEFLEASDQLKINNYNLLNTNKIKLNSVMYYRIAIQCYGKNDYGANVLGNYHFNFNKDGLIGDVNKYDWF